MEIRQAISMYLNAKAYQGDAILRVKLANENKSLDECVMFIQHKMLEKVTEEQKKGGAAVVIPSDDEIFALAEQYYMDDDLKIEGDGLDHVRMVSMSATTFTDEEKAEMRKEAITKYQNEVIAEQRRKDEERRQKAAKAKEKKPAAPIIVPDTTETSEEPKTETKQECVQMDLFG